MECRVYVISPAIDMYRNRLLNVIKRLIELGFHDVRFIKSLPDESKSNSLTKTVISIFKREINLNDKEPFIIVEDDVQLLNYQCKITIPEKTSAIYLGVSKWIYPHGYNCINKGKGIRKICSNDTTIVDEQLVKINGMLGTHGILFVNHKFIMDAITRMETHLIEKTPHDLIFASMQSEYNIYALKKPIFFQDKKLGGQENETRLIWKENTFY